MGHLARLTAMARRSGDGVRPQFLSMSRAVPVVEAEGFRWEYVPSRDDLGIGPRRWNRQFERRLTRVLLRDRPAAVVFDGTFPYDGLLGGDRGGARGRRRRPLGVVAARDVAAPAATAGSCRARAVRPGRRAGELAEAADRGATAGRTDAVAVGPVTLLDADELLPRARRPAALGVDPGRRRALLTLGPATSAT
jgi:hypothetical protein